MKNINKENILIPIENFQSVPMFIHTAVGEEICQKVRITDINHLLTKINGIETVENGLDVDLNLSMNKQNKIFICQRFWVKDLEWHKTLHKNNYIVINEIDDDPAIWDFFHKTNDYFAFRSSHAIQVSTKPIAEVLAKYNPNIKIFPNQIASLPSKRIYENNKITIFFGAINRKNDWMPILPSLNKIINTYKSEVQINVICDEQFYDSITIENKHFTPFCTYNEYQKILRMSDIAILPLEPNRLNKMKSDLKFIECAANGVAVLASPTVYADTIAEDKTGLIYDNMIDFENKLVKLIEDSQFRQTLANNAYAYVAQNRMLSQHIHKRVDWYNDLIENFEMYKAQIKDRAPELF